MVPQPRVRDGAGVAEITNQLEYDDDVAHQAVAKVYDLARGQDPRPWCLTVSFTHPHDPYVARRKYWDLYDDCKHLLPPGRSIPYDAQDPHSQRLMDACDWRAFDITDAQVRRARQGYFANISYVDDKIGEILAALDATRQEAIVLFLSDHGDMLGERGLWFKMNFFEGSARVPLMVAAPGLAPGRIATPVSTIDVTPTLCDLAGISMIDVLAWTDGESLVPLAQGLARQSPVAMEYAAEGSWAPLVALRKGAGSTSAARSIRNCSSTSRPIRRSAFNRAGDPAARAVLNEMRPLPIRAGISPPMMPMFAPARHGAGWSTRRCATAATFRGTTSRCRRPASATCAITWT